MEDTRAIIRQMADLIIATRDIRIGSGYVPMSYDFSKSWHESAREACGDNDLAVLVALMLIQPDDIRGNKYIIEWADKHHQPAPIDQHQLGDPP